MEPDQYTLAAGMSTQRLADRVDPGAHRRGAVRGLVREASEIPPGSDGLIMLPYFAGERTPIFDPRARGVIIGLTLRHRRGHLFRAAYEGIAFGIRQIVEFLEDDNNPVTTVDRGRRRHQGRALDRDRQRRHRAAPGDPRADNRSQLRRRAAGRDRHRPGAAGHELGPGRPPGRAGPGPHECYQELFDTYSALYPATKPHMHTLARLQEAAFDS